MNSSNNAGFTALMRSPRSGGAAFRCRGRHGHSRCKPRRVVPVYPQIPLPLISPKVYLPTLLITPPPKDEVFTCKILLR